MVIKKEKKITPISSKRVYLLAEIIKKKLLIHCKKIAIVGSIRRKTLAKDIDIILIPKGPISKEKIKQILIKLGAKIRASGSKNLFVKLAKINIDIFFVDSQSWGAQLMTRTGPWTSNIGNRTLAKNKGMLFNQYGLYNKKTGRRIAGKTEKEIFIKLGKIYKSPQMRGVQIVKYK